MRTWLLRRRIALASWLMGGQFNRVVMRLWLIRERAMAAVTEDGHVTLAECQPLADALYAAIPGDWTLTLTRHVTVEVPDARAATTEGGATSA